MTIGTSIFLIALGAILKFAVSDTIAGVELATIGLILMIVGALGVVLSFLLVDRARGADRVVERDRVVDRGPVA